MAAAFSFFMIRSLPSGLRLRRARRRDLVYELVHDLALLGVVQASPDQLLGDMDGKVGRGLLQLRKRAALRGFDFLGGRGDDARLLLLGGQLKLAAQLLRGQLGGRSEERRVGTERRERGQ